MKILNLGKIFLVILSLTGVNSFAQETIPTATGFATAAEGNLYRATDDGQIYIGLRNGTLKLVGGNIVVDNVTLSGTGTAANPIKLAQNGAANQQVMTWDSAINNWKPATPAAASNWLITGNANTTASNFLGTTNDVKLQLASNNTPMLEVGRRQTLGLYDSSSTGLYPYNQPDASVMYVRGTGGNSALQFEAGGASFYKPVFYTDSNGNFRLRGSSAGTDFFEMGSSGASNAGRFDFIIGDDGDEPFVFNKYNGTTATTVELMRLSGNGLNTNVRVGINTGALANSTLQNNGSLSTPTIITTAALTLTESHFTIIIGGNHAITLPAANTCTGRMYVIKNPTTNTPAISSYRNLSGTAVTALTANSIVWLQSDGTNWQRIN
ncbi:MULTISPECIES: hypothetical protein [unclassified Chryseobacterium]|uniref:hypothetical protein n=1 Tax=unclassified Chryseobacterium TaxID=2593645 RepID=UPI000D3AC7A8|nr:MULTISPECIES: hypothetical protein [unclassified Chryseobacterium]PTT75987.1 hypothetical protein DBR25_07055 [Chryseobacterium sp. HMWF001]PVV57295.1 hypothetical protein DD829_09030 [Chryseobacterium sp. HMWF035]